MGVSNLRIGTRLWGGFTLILMISILAGTVGILNMRSIANATREMTAVPLKKERLISDWFRNTSISITRTTAIVHSKDTDLAKTLAPDVKSTSDTVTDLQHQVEPLLNSDEEKQAYRHAADARAVYGKARDAAMLAKKNGDSAAADKILTNDFLPAAKLYSDNLNLMQDMQRKAIDDNAQHIEELYNRSLNWMIVLLGTGVLLGGVCAMLISRSVVRPIIVAVDAARRVAAGDLRNDIVVTSKDETGELLQGLKDMNQGLISIVSNVRSGTQMIATASAEIAAGNLDLSSRTEQQASSLEETAASMEELTSTVRQNFDNARQASELASSASQVAARGGEVMKLVVGKMDAINTSSSKIVDIISVIDSIAFQTNILALNAAVEAARAGEQGRGFAVVASEVRHLAHRSAAAAKEIKGLIDDSVKQISAGSKLVDEAGTTIGEMVSSVHRVTEIMSEITVASQEQTLGIDQMNQAIIQMDQVTQQNAALVEEAAAASQSMQDQADNLTQIVSVFQLRA